MIMVVPDEEAKSVRALWMRLSAVRRMCWGHDMLVSKGWLEDVLETRAFKLEHLIVQYIGVGAWLCVICGVVTDEGRQVCERCRGI